MNDFDAPDEMQWQIDQRTIRDCPGERTELEWRAAVRELETSLQNRKGRTCRACGQDLAMSHKFRVTETEGWMPNEDLLPRGRWALSASAATLTAARKLKKFMGPRATIWIAVSRRDNSISYRRFTS